MAAPPLLQLASELAAVGVPGGAPYFRNHLASVQP